MTVHETVQSTSCLSTLKLVAAVFWSSGCFLPGDWVNLWVGHLSGLLWFDSCFIWCKESLSFRARTGSIGQS